MTARGSRASRRGGFTIVELLVVIGIMALLIALLMPALQKARAQAKWVTCQSNMRQVGAALLIYSNNWRGWIYPPRLGAGHPVDQRWPVHVFKMNPPEGSTDVKDWTPAVMLCPTDFDPNQAHTYILNDHLFVKGVKVGTKVPRRSSSEMIVMGEKREEWPDYYMNAPTQRRPDGDYDTRVDPWKHGLRFGSNYLFLDWHVGTLPELEAWRGMDPWDFPDPVEDVDN